MIGFFLLFFFSQRDENISSHEIEKPPQLSPDTTISYLGPPGTYSHTITTQLFPPSKYTYTPQPTIPSVFDAVVNGATKLGVVPYENSRFGSVSATLDSFVEIVKRGMGGGMKIVGEGRLAVRHCLLVHKGCGGRIKKVYSHPQVMLKTSRYTLVQWNQTPDDFCYRHSDSAKHTSQPTSHSSNA